MTAHRGLVEAAQHDGFEFDYEHNTILFHSNVITISPDELDILRVLLNNRARPTPMGTLIQKVYGGCEPDAAAASIRVALHSLRKKIEVTGMKIKVAPRDGYEIEANHIPELNRRLPDKILIALNLALATGEEEIARLLRAALNMAEAKRQKWANQPRATMQAA